MGHQHPTQYRPAGPPELTSKRYTEVFNETKAMGSFNTTLRTAEETSYARFWATSTAVYNWNSVAIYLGAQRHMTLLDNAHLFAELNVAIADAVIACGMRSITMFSGGPSPLSRWPIPMGTC